MTIRQLLKEQIEVNDALFDLITKKGVWAEIESGDLSMRGYELRAKRMAALLERAQDKMNRFRSAAYLFMREL